MNDTDEDEVELKINSARDHYMRDAINSEFRMNDFGDF